jgi:hypothetical protein
MWSEGVKQFLCDNAKAIQYRRVGTYNIDFREQLRNFQIVTN